MPAASDPLAALLADKRSPATRRAYASDLWDFFGFGTPGGIGGHPSQAAVAAFLSLSVTEVAIRMNAYKAAMIGKKLSEATVNRRLAAVRSLLKFAYRIGQAKTDGRGLVDGEKVRSYRDTRGVGEANLTKIADAPDTSTLRGIRDAAMLQITIEQALRRGEVCALDVGDFDPIQRYVLIKGKGRGTQKELRRISADCVGKISAYLMASGHGTDKTNPLFLNVDRNSATAGHRLTTTGLYLVIRKYGAGLGIEGLAPHKLRHSAITLALDMEDGNFRTVAKFSRHKDIRTVQVYDDNRDDAAGKIAQQISDRLHGTPSKPKKKK